MRVDEFQWLFQSFAGFGAGMILTFSIVFLLFKLVLPGYLNEKGRNLATREDFDTLLEQIKKTTSETESIKAELSRHSWLTQQQWSIRERHYTELLGHIWKFKLSLQDRDEYYQYPGSEHDDSHTTSERFLEIGRRGTESFNALRDLIGPTSTFLSNKTVQVLQQLIRDHWGAAEFSSCPAEYIKSTLELAESAYVAVLAEAKNELAPANVGT